MPIVVHHPMQYANKAKRGSGENAGQCAVLPQDLLGSARCPKTCHWKRGARVMDTVGLTPGTVIATFNSNGDYHFVPKHHLAHTALYVSHSAHGIVVVHQHSEIPTIKRHEYLVGPQATHVQSADNYYVVEVK